MAGLDDIKNVAKKAEDAAKKAEDLAKKAGISEKDVKEATSKVADVAKDIIEKKTGKKD